MRTRWTATLILLCGCLFGGDQLATHVAAQQKKGPGTIVQLPTFGVAVDAEGIFRIEHFPDPGGRLRMQRMAAARAALPEDLARWSPLRKVSLVRLEAALQARLDAGQQPDDEMRNLAGLLRVSYVFCYPDEGDLVIAGPAEGFWQDPSGRMVGLTTGRPPLRLDDLCVALRAYAPGQPPTPLVGCSIGPRREALEKLREFQGTIPHVVRQNERAAVAHAMLVGTREALGMAQMQVFGISNQTHFAQVMLEADYRMKLIGIGLEPKPVPMVTFLEALSVPRHSVLQRWWFTPNYQCLRVSDDGLGIELVGLGVQLETEDKFITPDGRITPIPGEPSVANQRYADSFTSHYAEIANRVPVFADLRNVIDLAVVAAYMQRFDFYRQCGWSMTLLADETRLPVQVLPEPRQVPCVVNAVWKRNRLIAPAGGVTIQPSLALEPDQRLADEDAQVAAQYRQTAEARVADAERWWWD